MAERFRDRVQHWLTQPLAWVCGFTGVAIFTLSTRALAQPDRADESLQERAGAYQRMADWLRRPDESLRAASDLAGMLQTGMYEHLTPLFVLAGFAGLSTALVGMMYSPRDFNLAKVGLFLLLAVVATTPVPFPRGETTSATGDMAEQIQPLQVPDQRTGALGFVVIDTLFSTAHLYVIEMVRTVTGGRVGEDRFGSNALKQMSTLTSQDLSSHLGAAPEIVHLINDYDSQCQKVGHFGSDDPGWSGQTPLTSGMMKTVGLAGNLSGYYGNNQDQGEGAAEDTMRHARFNPYNLPDAEVRGYAIPTTDFWLRELEDQIGSINMYDNVGSGPDGGSDFETRPPTFVADPSTTVYPLRGNLPRDYHWEPTNCWQLFETVNTALGNYWEAQVIVYEDPDGQAELAALRDAIDEARECDGRPARDTPSGACANTAIANSTHAMGTQKRMISQVRTALDEDELPSEPSAAMETAMDVVTNVGTETKGLFNRVTLAFSIPIGISIAAAGYLLAGLLFPLVCALAILPSQHNKFWITMQIMAFIHITMLLVFLILEVGGWAWYLVMSIGSQSTEFGAHLVERYAILGFAFEIAIYIGVLCAFYLAFLLVTANVYGAVMGMAKVGSSAGPGGVARAAAAPAQAAGAVAGAKFTPAGKAAGGAMGGAKNAMSGTRPTLNHSPGSKSNSGGGSNNTTNSVRKLKAAMQKRGDGKS